MIQYLIGGLIVFLIILLIVGIVRYTHHDSFTAPGLTVTSPPNWWNPQPYINNKPSRTKMYLDRITENDNKAASAYRFWRL